MTNTPSATLNKPFLRQGSKGEDVKELQELLSRNNVSVTVDGDFGPQTKSAVEFFQFKMFLKVDGEVGNNTWGALYKGAPINMPILRKGSKGELVEKMQDRLCAGGYYNSTVDGDFGPATEAAVKDLQKYAGLSVDGIVGDRTWFEVSKINTIFC